MTEMHPDLMTLTDRKSSVFPKQKKTWSKQDKTYNKLFETRDEEKTL